MNRRRLIQAATLGAITAGAARRTATAQEANAVPRSVYRENFVHTKDGTGFMCSTGIQADPFRYWRPGPSIRQSGANTSRRLLPAATGVLHSTGASRAFRHA